MRGNALVGSEISELHEIRQEAIPLSLGFYCEYKVSSSPNVIISNRCRKSDGKHRRRSTGTAEQSGRDRAHLQ